MKRRAAWLVAGYVLALAVFVVLWPFARPGTRAAPLVVAADERLRGPVGELVAEYRRQRDQRVRVEWGPAEALAQRVAAGEAVDAFLSASPEPVQGLARRGLLLPSSSRTLTLPPGPGAGPEVCLCAVGIPAGTRQARQAELFVGHVTSPAAAGVFRAHGFGTVARRGP